MAAATSPWQTTSIPCSAAAGELPANAGSPSPSTTSRPDGRGSSTTCAPRLLLDGAPLVEPRERLRLAFAVVGVELLDAQPAFDDNRVDLTVEVAATEDTLLHTVESLLPTPHADVRRGAVLDEVQPATGAKHAPDLTYGGDRVGDGAQAPRAQCVVHRLVREGQSLPVQPDHVDVDVAGSDPL